MNFFKLTDDFEFEPYCIVRFQGLKCWKIPISVFYIRNPILTLELGRKSRFDIQNPILTFEFVPKFTF